MAKLAQCPKCESEVKVSFSGSHIFLAIITFPLGLLFLLLPRTCRCDNCGFKFQEGRTRPIDPAPLQERHAPPVLTANSGGNSKEQCPHCGMNSVVKMDGLQGSAEIIPAVIAGVLCLLPAVIYYWLIERLPYCLQCNRRIAGYPAPVLTTMAAVILVPIMIVIVLNLLGV